jgi:uncharacterized membrane protein
MSQLIFVTFDNENLASEMIEKVRNRKNNFQEVLNHAVVVSINADNTRKVEQISSTKGKRGNWLVPLINDIVQSRESVIKKATPAENRMRLQGPLTRYGIEKNFTEKIRVELKPHTSALVLWTDDERKPQPLVDLFEGQESHVLTTKVTAEEYGRIQEDFRRAA